MIRHDAMNNGIVPGRFILAAGGASLGILAAGFLIALLFNLDGNARLITAIVSIVAAAGVTAYVATHGRAEARDLARKIDPQADAEDLAAGIDGLLARVRDLEAAA